MIKSSFFIMEIMKIFSTSNRKIILFLPRYTDSFNFSNMRLRSARLFANLHLIVKSQISGSKLLL